jgi:parvulin-like peptidyl-prolyl isomerase
VRRWLSDPLLQFLFAGLLLFAAYGALQPPTDPRLHARRIELTSGDLRQLGAAWSARGRPAPSPDQMQSLVAAKVREEILYREALALGLDEDDTIVKRRLAQKMEFLFEDVAALREPTGEELRLWFEGNAERFALPARAAFRHLYFAPDRRGEQARPHAAGALAQLTGQPGDAPAAAALGDPFMFESAYGERTFEEVAATFGDAFAASLFGLAPGSWQGPIESGYGWHLVWVDSITPGRIPAFDDVARDVRTAWTEEQRAAIRQQAFEAIRRRYEVVLPEAVAAGAGTGARPADVNG